MKLPIISSDRFYHDLLARMATTLAAGSAAAVEVFGDVAAAGPAIDRMRDLEHEADGIAHQVMTQLHKHPFAPFDRTDLADLIQRMDDVMDYMEEAAAAVHIYRVHRTRPRAVEASQLLPVMTRCVTEAIALLGQHQLQAIRPLLVELHDLENRADTVFRAAMAELFEEEANPAEVIKWRAIYSDLEDASDSADAVAVVLEGIVMGYS
jgi:predicted phosphate transport protein (TIGR00153 family)